MSFIMKCLYTFIIMLLNTFSDSYPVAQMTLLSPLCKSLSENRAVCKFETANYFYGELWDNRKFRSALGAFSKEATGYESVTMWRVCSLR